MRTNEHGYVLPSDPDEFERDYGSLDPLVKPLVKILMDHGVETFESCEGGEGHSYAEPTIRFSGSRSAGWHALNIAQCHGLPVGALRRVWPLVDHEPTGPYWEMTFRVSAAQPKEL